MTFGTCIWCPLDYILEWYKKISNIHLKDDILKEINDKFTSSEDVATLFTSPKFPDSRWISIKELSLDFYK